jgi:hypothetical protein
VQIRDVAIDLAEPILHGVAEFSECVDRGIELLEIDAEAAIIGHGRSGPVSPVIASRLVVSRISYPVAASTRCAADSSSVAMTVSAPCSHSTHASS